MKIFAIVYVLIALVGIALAGEHAEYAERTEKQRDEWIEKLIDAGFERVNE